MSESVLISQYPLTADYLLRFKEKNGETPETIVVSNITADGYMGLYRYFRTIKKQKLYIALVDFSTHPATPPLVMISWLISVKHRIIIDPGFNQKTIGIGDLIQFSSMFAKAVFAGYAAFAKSAYLAFRLKNKNRVEVFETTYKNVFYLKSNLWLGVQAGGALTHTMGVITGLVNNGFRVRYVSSDGDFKGLDKASVETRAIPLFDSFCVPRELNYYRLNLRSMNEKWITTNSDSRFIYQRLSPGNIAGVMRSRIHKIPLIIEYNGSEVWLSRNWGTPFTFEKMALRMEDITLRHAHLIVVVSKALKSELIGRGIQAERIICQPNGVDIKRFDPAIYDRSLKTQQRQKLGVPEKAFVVTFVGTFGMWHGVNVLASALRHFFDVDPMWMKKHQLHILFVGDGVHRPGIEKILDFPGLEKYFTLGNLISPDKIPSILAASDAFISPTVGNPDGTEFFGSPTKLFEYLSMGRPVIASDIAQISDVLKNSPVLQDCPEKDNNDDVKTCGIRVRPGNEADIIGAIRYLAEHPKWCVRAGINARHLAKSNYTWDQHVSAVLSAIDGMPKTSAASQPLRILVNGLHSKSGGGVTYLKNTLGLFAQDPDVEIHLCIHESQHDIITDENNIHVHRLKFKQGFWRLLWKEQVLLPRLVQKISADVTFSPANYGPIVAKNTVILLRNALSVAFVEKRFGKLIYWFLLSVGTAFSMARAKQIITVSDYAKKSAGGGLLDIFKNKFTIIPHGISQQFHSCKSKRQSFLLAVSDLYVQKNLKNLILSIAELKRDDPGILLKIAGRPIDKHYADELTQLVEIKGLQNNVEFLGHVDVCDLVLLYQRCQLFVFPSSIETFGNPLVEAMASGAPVVCSNVAAMPEVVGDAAQFFDPLNVQDMVYVIKNVMRNQKLKREMSAKSTEQAKLYSWQKTASKTLDVLKRAGGLEKT